MQIVLFQEGMSAPRETWVAVKGAEPFIGGTVVNRSALLSLGVCFHKDRQMARELIRPSIVRVLDIILEFFLKHVGTLEDIIADARKVNDLAYDSHIWRVGGMGHEENSHTIEILGKEVLPEIHSWPEHPNATPASTWAPTSEGTT